MGKGKTKKDAMAGEAAQSLSAKGRASRAMAKGKGSEAGVRSFDIRKFLLYLLRHVWDYSWVSWADVEAFNRESRSKNYTLEEMQKVAENAWRKGFKYFECRNYKVRAIRRKGNNSAQQHQPSRTKAEPSNKAEPSSAASSNSRPLALLAPGAEAEAPQRRERDDREGVWKKPKVSINPYIDLDEQDSESHSDEQDSESLSSLLD